MSTIYYLYESHESGKLFCCYCGNWLVHPFKISMEHLVPVSKGGNNKLINKRPCCHGCNKQRGNQPLYNWLKILEEKLRHSVKYNGHGGAYDLEIKIENVKYWIDYIEQRGRELYRNDNVYFLNGDQI